MVQSLKDTEIAAGSPVMPMLGEGDSSSQQDETLMTSSIPIHSFSFSQSSCQCHTLLFSYICINAGFSWNIWPELPVLMKLGADSSSKGQCNTYFLGSPFSWRHSKLLRQHTVNFNEEPFSTAPTHSVLCPSQALRRDSARCSSGRKPSWQNPLQETRTSPLCLPMESSLLYQKLIK